MTRAGVAAAGLALALGGAAPASAHAPARAVRAAPVDPVEALLAAAAVAVALLYARGLFRLWRRAGRGRGVRVGAALAFAAGWGAAAVALFSPLDAAGSVRFSAHMAQHELLMLVAAPLVVAGRPHAALLFALAPRARAALGRLARRPGVQRAWRTAAGLLGAWVVHAVALWIWHVPALFEATLRSDLVHGAQHASFLGSALLYWGSVIGRAARRHDRGLALLSLFTTALHGGALGALLTFAPRPWVPAYVAAARAHGLDPLADQQLAGLLMWIPSGVLFTAVAVALTARWLQDAARRAPRPAARAVARPS